MKSKSSLLNLFPNGTKTSFFGVLHLHNHFLDQDYNDLDQGYRYLVTKTCDFNAALSKSELSWNRTRGTHQPLLLSPLH